MITTIITQASQKSDLQQPVSPAPGCPIEELINLDTPPIPKIDSPEIYRTKQQQLRVLKAFLEKEIGAMQKQQHLDTDLLRKSKENLAQVLNIPAVAALKSIVDDPDLLAADGSYWETVKGLVEASNKHTDETLQSQGTVRTFLNQSGQSLPSPSGSYGPGRDILASNAHTSALDALKTALRKHATLEKETSNKARQASSSDLVQFLINRASLADRIRLMKLVNEQLIWSNEQPWAP